MTTSPRSARWMAAAILLVTFGAGALVGLVVERSLLAEEVAELPPLPPDRASRDGRPPPGGRGDDGPPASRIFAEDSPISRFLEITDEQREEINTIVEEDRRKAGQMFREFRPRLQARYDSTNTAIMEVLSAEQRAEFERLQAERSEHLRRRFDDRRRDRDEPN